MRFFMGTKYTISELTHNAAEIPAPILYDFDCFEYLSYVL